ncbi:DUF3177 family protein [Fischerella thermalis]|jgi:hypothetical protein|uniref:DUF3177 family protein n=1 Tax=Fischerella thermalis JSC-11 TaxID=741277 RepID=G6FNF8_9CYAN|nr:DUF3177 family protein [Fischerella thermalis]PMB06430.1 DUF3177 domain-containing protein [Fischerella thermalis CCMEE 5328]PMB08484.1 DUF3177 domain-containing protein [Fischerella thermalis CCMEE 5273]RDH51919.1 hypothetical protein CBF18_03340 [Mastigocladus laminosus WC112]EHC19588.1 hypothetical protein FJSC11DRAFT_0405 [Fischerella thermalis JSC-11]PLZ09075.1 hypothetical protein CBP17_14665 [Fischerella thermalis WC114]
MEKEVWFRPFVWMDYRLAVLFTVVIPLILLIWAFVQKAEGMQRLLAIYWRVSSLLAITIYLMIAQYPVSFISGFMGRILIPISLWFWVDLNDEIEYQSSGPLKLTFTSWRWATTVYCILGSLAFIPFLGCAFSENVSNNPNCYVWFEAPLGFKEWFHPNTSAGFLGILGILGLVIYVLYLIYFVLIKLGKQGRSATQQ